MRTPFVKTAVFDISPPPPFIRTPPPLRVFHKQTFIFYFYRPAASTSRKRTYQQLQDDYFWLKVTFTVIEGRKIKSGKLRF